MGFSRCEALPGYLGPPNIGIGEIPAGPMGDIMGPVSNKDFHEVSWGFAIILCGHIAGLHGYKAGA